MRLPKCQTCDGTGTEVTEIANNPSHDGKHFVIDELHEPCPDCGGTGRRPNYEAARGAVDSAMEWWNEDVHGDLNGYIAQCVIEALEEVTPQ